MSKDPEQRALGAQDEGITLSPLSVDDWRLWRDLRIEALREAAYAFGSKLSDWQGPGDTEERWRARLTDVPLNIVARLDGKPVGMVSAISPDVKSAELISMWVAPFARGSGVGDALIQAVVSWAERQHARQVVLAVRADNERAIALYARHEFIDSGPVRNTNDGEPPERLMTTTLASSRAQS